MTWNKISIYINMNIILDRDYHEVVGKLIKFEMTEEMRLGQELLSRIPYNYIGEQEELFKNKTDLNPLAMSEEDLSALIPKLNFNMPETKLRFMEKLFIEKKDYWSLFELIKDEHPYNLTNDFAVYTYCRQLCGMPVTNEEHRKIQQDLKTLKKGMKQIENKKMKKKKGVYSVKF
tara:strand:- start:2701 stop:3225 length:525 start_codon:yes stop_codon:yes gene_type:complete